MGNGIEVENGHNFTKTYSILDIKHILESVDQMENKLHVLTQHFQQQKYGYRQKSDSQCMRSEYQIVL